MSNTGFAVSELKLQGRSASDAGIQLDPHLTIIAGASNTGKSYIYQCIKYMLGSGTRPKDVKAAVGYSLIQLELMLSGQRKFVLERILGKAGDFKLYRAALSEIQHVSAPAVLSSTHSQDDADNISTFLLRLSGFGDGLRLLDKKATNETRALWFHDVRPFFLVDEVRMISEQSPVRPSGQYTKTTVETAAFDLMISGQDWSALVAKPKKLEVRVAFWQARSTLLQELIVPLEEALAECPPAAEIVRERERSEARIANAMRELSEVGEHVKALSLKRKELLDEKRPKELRIRIVEQLLRQFGLLGESYHSDLERLEFIEEAASLTSQLGTQNCPTCGQPFPESEGDEHQHLTAEDQIQAAHSERMKITLHLDDLAQTIEALSAESRDLTEQILALDRQAVEVDAMVTAARQQRSKPLEESLAEENKILEELTRQINDWRQLDVLRAKLRDLGDEPRARRKGEEVVDSEPRVPTLARREFCDFLESTLAAWKLPEAGTVEFDSEMNLIVGGVPARSNGKGVRAIITSAFVVGLMRYCLEHGLPHPGIVLLDSPLTSYKEKEREEVGEEVQQAFYNDLAGSRAGGQVIILENKEPPADSQAIARYYHFTGKRDDGRYGFFPVV
jgi:hypothetical protein